MNTLKVAHNYPTVTSMSSVQLFFSMSMVVTHIICLFCSFFFFFQSFPTITETPSKVTLIFHPKEKQKLVIDLNGKNL